MNSFIQKKEPALDSDYSLVPHLALPHSHRVSWGRCFFTKCTLCVLYDSFEQENDVANAKMNSLDYLTNFLGTFLSRALTMLSAWRSANIIIEHRAQHVCLCILLCLTKTRSFFNSEFFINLVPELKYRVFLWIPTYYKNYAKLLITTLVPDPLTHVQYYYQWTISSLFVSRAKYLTRGLRKRMVI